MNTLKTYDIFIHLPSNGKFKYFDTYSQYSRTYACKKFLNCCLPYIISKYSSKKGQTLGVYLYETDVETEVCKNIFSYYISSFQWVDIERKKLQFSEDYETYVHNKECRIEAFERIQEHYAEMNKVYHFDDENQPF